MHAVVKRPDGWRRLAGVLMLGGVVVPGAVWADQPPAHSERGAVGSVPLVFEPNRGQAQEDVRFLSRGPGFTLLLTRTGGLVSLTSPRSGAERPPVLGFEVLGAEAAEIQAQEPLAGRSHYFVGNDTSRWVPDIPQFARVSYAAMLPGVDLVFHGARGRLEYDFVVRPGADPASIRLRFTRHDTMRLAEEGDLVFGWPGVELRHAKPVAYELPSRRPLAARFVRLGPDTVGFAVDEWDGSHPIVIDPVLGFATYLGGHGNDTARAVAVDSSGNVYVAGTTTSAGFPVVGGVQGMAAGTSDAFVTKLDPTGTSVLYSTYVGGSSLDEGRGIAVDATGRAVLVGSTTSPNFPAGGPLTTNCATGDAFYVRLSASGNALAGSFCFGTGGTDSANGVALDAGGNAYLTGSFGGDVFVRRLNAAATAWDYQNALAGSSFDEGHAIGVNATGEACVAGQTTSANFPVLNARQPTIPASSQAAFVAKYTPAGALVFSTYLGGATFLDAAFGAGVDAAGNCYVSGVTRSTTFPTVAALQAAYGGGNDAFVTAYTANGSAYLYSTYLGGSGQDIAQALAVEPDGTVHVVGQSASANFPSSGALQPELKDLGAVFVSANGGSSFSRAILSGLSVQAIAVDPANAQVLYAGTSNGIYKSTNGGGTWARVDSLQYAHVLDLAVEPGTPCRIHAAVDTFLFPTPPLSQNSTAILAISPDCGATWGFLPAGPSGRVGRSVAVAATNPPAVYLGMIANGTSSPGHRVARAVPGQTEYSYPGFDFSFVVATDPANPCTAYAGGFSGRVYQNTSCTTLSWATIGAALDAQVTALAAHPTNGATLLAGTAAGTIYRKQDAGSPWIAVGTAFGAVSDIVYQPGSASVVYLAGDSGQLLKSTDGGASWSIAATIGPISAIGVTPAAANAVVAGTRLDVDAFYARLGPSGALLEATWFGGHGHDQAYGVAAENGGGAVLVGRTAAFDLPTTMGAAYRSASGNGDAFIARVTPGAPCSYAINPTSVTVSAAADTGQVNVTAPPGCGWSAASNDAFLAVTAGAGGSGNGVVSFAILANGPAARTGTLTIAGLTFTVNQPGAGTACTYVPSPPAVTVGAAAGTGSFTVTAPVGCGWTATTVAPWLSLSGASGSGSGTVGYSYASNPTPSSRVATVLVAGQPLTITQAAGPVTSDADGDGLPDGWEQQFGLDSLSAAATEGAAGDPDQDGVSNLDEYRNGTHPRNLASASRYLAEGATSAFFDVRLALANPGPARATANVRFLPKGAPPLSHVVHVAAFGRATIDVAMLPGMAAAEFSTVVETDVPLLVDRTMTWDTASGFGSHAETATVAPALVWYLAEGATHSAFDLFYLLQNPNATSADVEVTFLLPVPQAPVVRTYVVPPSSRETIWVDLLPGVDSTDVSAILRVTNGQPIIVERAMYASARGTRWAAGHDSVGVTAPANRWFLAEGATGDLFDMFVLLANPGQVPITVDMTYLLDSGIRFTKPYSLGPQSRRTVWVDLEDPRLANASLSVIVQGQNGAELIVERSMWWPGPTPATWTEAHNSPGTTATGTSWGLAEGEVGGPRGTETYILIANTSAYGGLATVTLLLEDGTTVAKSVALAPNSRKTIGVQFEPEFQAAIRRAGTTGLRFGAVVDSVGATPAQIVVERAMYSSDGGAAWFLPYWPAGTDALASRLR